MIYESGEETGGLIEEREPFHKTRITLRVGEKRAGNAREKERESAFQSLCMRRLVRWLWRGKKNITRGHLIARHRMPPAKSPNPKAGFEQKKKDRQACPKFDAGSSRWSCRWSDKDGYARRATGTGACIGEEKNNNRWKFVVRATWRPNWYNDKNGAFQRYHGEFSFICKCGPAATLQRLHLPRNLCKKPIRFFCWR